MPCSTYITIQLCLLPYRRVPLRPYRLARAPTNMRDRTFIVTLFHKLRTSVLQKFTLKSYFRKQSEHAMSLLPQ